MGVGKIPRPLPSGQDCMLAGDWPCQLRANLGLAFAANSGLKIREAPNEQAPKQRHCRGVIEGFAELMPHPAN